MVGFQHIRRNNNIRPYYWYQCDWGMHPITIRSFSCQSSNEITWWSTNVNTQQPELIWAFERSLPGWGIVPLSYDTIVNRFRLRLKQHLGLPSWLDSRLCLLCVLLHVLIRSIFNWETSEKRFLAQGKIHNFSIGIKFRNDRVADCIYTYNLGGSKRKWLHKRSGLHNVVAWVFIWKITYSLQILPFCGDCPECSLGIHD